jgi:hypothetical protein
MNPLAKAGYFGILFDKAPTYNEIAGLGTHNLTAAPELNQLFRAKNVDSGDLAEREGFEPSRGIAPPYRFSKPTPSTTWVPLHLKL